MNLKEQLKAIQDELQGVVDRAKAQKRDLTRDEIALVEQKADEAKSLRKQIDHIEKSERILAEIAGDVSSDDDSDGVKRLALTGRNAKSAATRITSVIRERGGSKAIVSPGTVTTEVPTDTTPLEQRRVPTSVLDLMPLVRHDSPTWRGFKQTGFVNNASIVPPGALKPTSTVSIVGYEQSLSVIAHLSEPVDKFILEDNTALVSFVAGNLLYGLALALEEELINGDGSTFTVSGVETRHFNGILGSTGVQEQDFLVDRPTTLRAAATKLEVIGFTPDVYVLSAADWEAIETARNLSGSFDLNGPVDRAERKLWGTQVVTSTKLDAGQALALDLQSMHVDADNAGIRTLWDGSGELFDRNQVKARVEGRFGFSLERPEGAVVVNLDAAA